MKHLLYILTLVLFFISVFQGRVIQQQQTLIREMIKNPACLQEVPKSSTVKHFDYDMQPSDN
jgi:hypothetical protein